MAIYPVKARPRAVSTLAETATNSDPAVCRLIAAHPVLGTLPEHDWRPLLGWSRIRNVRRQEVICRQGDPVSAVILVLEGYVKLSTSIVDGDEIFLDIAGSGGCFGDLTTLQKQPHDANITALSLCRLLMIDARQFRCAFEHRPEGLLAIMRLASERLQIVALHLMENQVRTAPARLAKALLRLAGLSPPGSGRAADLPVQLTQSELGAMTGVCREVINRQLSAWRDLGWIQMSGGTVKSVDATALSTML
jgi:CRP-like cAMP-binding protein